MNNPFYIYTPRNMFGESLVGESIHCPAYEIRSIHTGKESHGESKNLKHLKELMAKLANEYATNLCLMANI